MASSRLCCTRAFSHCPCERTWVSYAYVCPCPSGALHTDPCIAHPALAGPGWPRGPREELSAVESLPN